MQKTTSFSRMKPDFDKMDGLIPAVVQDSSTRRVLMVGFMNEEAFDITKRDKKVTFYSRTRKKLWTKGEESGNFLYVKKIINDCDNDTLLIKVKPAGPVCHTGSDTCFEEKNKPGVSFLMKLEKIIKKRKKEMPEGSYTSKLFSKGTNKIAKKLGEEAIELVIESKDDNDDLFLNEAADLLYHLEVLLVSRKKSLTDVVKILELRHK